MEVTLPEEYAGPPLVIDGAGSVAGKINDFWSPPGLPQRRSNIKAIQHWDGKCPPHISRARGQSEIRAPLRSVRCERSANQKDLLRV